MYMKSFRFGWLTGVHVFLLLALLAFPMTRVVYAADDLPPPSGGLDPDPAPQNPIGDEAPAPSLGEEDLPDPAVGAGPEDNNFQVNRIDQEDEVYLPSPMTQDTVNFNPAGAPVANPNSVYADYWRNSVAARPAFAMQLGTAFRFYESPLVEDRKAGITLGANLRLINIAQTVFLHIFASATYFRVGDIGEGNNAFRNVRDLTYHAGPLLEIGLGRKFSLFGSFFRRWNYLTAEPKQVATAPNADVRNLNFIGEPTNYKFGLGAQWDFYVIPHGSLGVRAHIEQNYGYVALTMAIEPAPPKRFNLNFESMDRR
jgi:hypothetical protein